jgi:hypothetical protein
MARLPHHSSNYGGARAGAGRPAGGFNRLAQVAIEKANAAPVHPMDFLLGIVADKKASLKDRAGAAQAVLPYIQSKLSISELNITNPLDSMSEADLQLRLEAINQQLLEQAPSVIEGQVIKNTNGSAKHADT